VHRGYSRLVCGAAFFLCCHRRCDFSLVAGCGRTRFRLSRFPRLACARGDLFDFLGIFTHAKRRLAGPVHSRFRIEPNAAGGNLHRV
jgi:hypothetical protein